MIKEASIQESTPRWGLFARDYSETGDLASWKAWFKRFYVFNCLTCKKTREINVGQFGFFLFAVKCSCGKPMAKGNEAIPTKVIKSKSIKQHPYQLWIYRRWWVENIPARFKAGKEKGTIWISAKGKNVALKSNRRK